MRTTKRKISAVKTNIWRHKYFWLILVGILVVLDQVSKILIQQSGKTIDLIILKLNYVTNTGASFGMLKGFNILFVLISIAVLIFLYINRENIPKWSLIFICGGILGNLVDRVLLGHVVDFIDFGFWPVFNFADTFINIGIILWIILLVKEWAHKKESRSKSR